MSIFMRNALILPMVAVAASVSAPAVAQNVAYADPLIVVVNTNAFKTGFQQINQNYAQNVQQMDAKEQELTQLLLPLDTNKDGNLSDAELAAAPKATVDKVNQLNAEMQQLQQPILVSRIYVVEQINAQYSVAQANVVKAKKIGVILKPEAFIYAPESADLTQSLVAEIDKGLPQAQITPPAGWQPMRGSVQTYQQIEELLQADAAMRQRQAQQQGGAQPQKQPAPAPSDGR